MVQKKNIQGSTIHRTWMHTTQHSEKNFGAGCMFLSSLTQKVEHIGAAQKNAIIALNLFTQELSRCTSLSSLLHGCRIILIVVM